MSSNTKMKQKLIQLFGPECFIEKLHLRHDEKPRRYKSKHQYKRMKKLSYHHIIEKSKGGPTTIENGALLSVENHEWFHKQSKADQARMNQIFKDYKACKVVFTDELDLRFKVCYNEIVLKPKKKTYSRAKAKRKFKERIKEYESELNEDDER